MYTRRQNSKLYMHLPTKNNVYNIGTRSKTISIVLFFFFCFYIYASRNSCIICILCGQSPSTDDRRLSNILYNIISLYCHFVHNLARTNYFQMFTFYESRYIVYTMYKMLYMGTHWRRSLRRGRSCRIYFILCDDDSSRPTRCAGQEIIIQFYAFMVYVLDYNCHLHGLSDFTFRRHKCSWRQFSCVFVVSCSSFLFQTFRVCGHYWLCIALQYSKLIYLL